MFFVLLIRPPPKSTRTDTLCPYSKLFRAGEARSLLESILVLAVGTQMTAKEGEGESATPARTVTLALRPDQLSAFTLARSLGAIYLALRNPADAAMPGPARAMLRDIRPGDTAPPTRIAYRPTPRPEEHTSELQSLM